MRLVYKRGQFTISTRYLTPHRDSGCYLPWKYSYALYFSSPISFYLFSFFSSSTSESNLRNLYVDSRILAILFPAAAPKCSCWPLRVTFLIKTSHHSMIFRGVSVVMKRVIHSTPPWHSLKGGGHVKKKKKIAMVNLLTSTHSSLPHLSSIAPDLPTLKGKVIPL